MSAELTASCMSTRTATLLLVVDRYSQVLGAAVHQYSQLIRNLNPSLTAMIQLKPGIPPASLNKPTHSAARRKNRMERKKNGGLRFKRVFSDAAVAPFDQIEWERRTAEITDDGGKVIFKQENVEVPKTWSLLATKIVVSKYFYGDSQRHRPVQGRTRNFGAPAHSSRHPHDRRLGHQGRLFRRRGSGGDFLRRADLAVPEPVRRVQFAGLVQRRAVSPIRHRQRRRARAIGSTIARRARPSARRRNTNIRSAAPASSSRWRTTWRTSCAWRHSEAMLFKYGSGTGTDLSPLRSTQGKTERRRQAQRPAVLPESLRPGRQRGEDPAARRAAPPR